MLIHNKDDIEFVTEFPCFLGHPVYYLELYPNMSIARENPNGLVAFSILVQITESLYRKSDFDFISVHLDKVRL